MEKLCSVTASVDVSAEDWAKMRLEAEVEEQPFQVFSTDFDVGRGESLGPQVGFHQGYSTRAKDGGVAVVSFWRKGAVGELEFVDEVVA